MRRPPPPPPTTTTPRQTPRMPSFSRSNPYHKGVDIPNDPQAASAAPSRSSRSQPASPEPPSEEEAKDELSGGSSNHDGLPVCGVCFDTFRMRGFILCCDHQFCYPCIQKWALSKKTCPHCSRTFTEVLSGLWVVPELWQCPTLLSTRLLVPSCQPPPPPCLPKAARHWHSWVYGHSEQLSKCRWCRGWSAPRRRNGSYH